MNKARHTYWLSFGSLRVLMSLVAFAAATTASIALAQPAVQFEIGESARLLEASLQLQQGEITQAEFDLIQFEESCKNPSQRLQDRNRPFISVWNTSDTPDEITTVTIDLTEPGFEFGDGDVVGDGFDGFLSILATYSDPGASLDSATYGADNTELVLNFSGLTQNAAAIFRIDLDEPAGIAMFPGFDEAMLGADRGNGVGQRATLTTDFSSGATQVALFAQSGPVTNAGTAQAYHAQSMSPIVPSTIIPEPTSIALLFVGLSGIAATRRKR